jgi:hypothetical protein
MSSMRRITSTVVLALLVGAVTAATVLAANVHFKAKGGPSFTDNGLSLSAAGTLTGLGGGDVVITVTVNNAQPVATCTNPSGASKPPGQNPARATLTGVEAIPGPEIKNGNLDFNVSTGTPTTPIAGAPDCPNSSWTEDITDVIFFGLTPPATATITVYQPCTDTTTPIDCPVVLSQSFTL